MLVATCAIQLFSKCQFFTECECFRVCVDNVSGKPNTWNAYNVGRVTSNHHRISSPAFLKITPWHGHEMFFYRRVEFHRAVKPCAKLIYYYYSHLVLGVVMTELTLSAIPRLITLYTPETSSLSIIRGNLLKEFNSLPSLYFIFLSSLSSQV